MTFCSRVDGRGSDLHSLRQLQDATGLLSTPLQNHWRPFSPFFFLSLTSSRLSLALQDLVIKSWGEPTSSTKRLPDIVDKRTKRTVHFSLGTVLIAVKGVSRHASIVLRRARQFTVALAPASPVEPAPISSGPGHVA